MSSGHTNILSNPVSEGYEAEDAVPIPDWLPTANSANTTFIRSR